MQAVRRYRWLGTRVAVPSPILIRGLPCPQLAALLSSCQTCKDPNVVTWPRFAVHQLDNSGSQTGSHGQQTEIRLPLKNLDGKKHKIGQVTTAARPASLTTTPFRNILIPDLLLVSHLSAHTKDWTLFPFRSAHHQQTLSHHNSTCSSYKSRVSTR